MGRPGMARLMCMPYMYALCVCLMCMPYVYALCVCLICMPYMYALYVWLTGDGEADGGEPEQIPVSMLHTFI